MPAGAYVALPNNALGQFIEAGPFIIACLVPEDVERFKAAILSKTDLVEPVDLIPILRWLINEAWTVEDPPKPNGQVQVETSAGGP